MFSCENNRFSWSEWGDSNSRHLETKSSALPTGPHSDIYFFFMRKVGKHVVKFHFLPPKADYLWKFLLVPQRLFRSLRRLSTSRAPAPKPGALPAGPHPDIYFFFLRKVVKHVVKFHSLPPKADCLWKFLLVPQRLFCFPGRLSTSRAPASKPGALPTGPHPDMQLPAAASRHTAYFIPPLPDCQ